MAILLPAACRLPDCCHQLVVPLLSFSSEYTILCRKQLGEAPLWSAAVVVYTHLRLPTPQGLLPALRHGSRCCSLPWASYLMEALGLHGRRRRQCCVLAVLLRLHALLLHGCCGVPARFGSNAATLLRCLLSMHLRVRFGAVGCPVSYTACCCVLSLSSCGQCYLVTAPALPHAPLYIWVLCVAGFAPGAVWLGLPRLH